jgi:PleD family two-component response regulator
VGYLLFADDSEPMRAMVRDLLSAGGHEVATVPDGAAALAAVAAREPDLLLLDIDMPALSGLDVLRSVKGNPFTAHIPVLMLTGQGSVEFKVEGLESGADDYLPKPFDPRELRARVQALLRLVRREGDRNPTSGLPGGRAIDEELARRVAAGATFSVCYIDIDNFKPFADVFGFGAADSVIHALGRALVEVARETPAPTFVAHIGGDDFLLVTDAEQAASVAERTQRRFVRVVEHVIGEEAVRAGTFRGAGRDGHMRDFPVACISAAVLDVRPDHWQSTAQLGVAAAELKREAKQIGGGTIARRTV